MGKQPVFSAWAPGDLVFAVFQSNAPCVRCNGAVDYSEGEWCLLAQVRQDADTANLVKAPLTGGALCADCAEAWRGWMKGGP